MTDLRVLTIKQVAELVQLSPRTVMRAVRAGDLMPPSSRKAEAVGVSKNPRSLRGSPRGATTLVTAACLRGPSPRLPPRRVARRFDRA